MAFIAINYAKNENAPVGKWTCAPTSSLAAFEKLPAGEQTKGKDLCGQCVSYVKKVCPTLPPTPKWKKGASVKDNKDIKEGTVIATFDASGNYNGHAAIYVRQYEKTGVLVYDQYITGKNGSPVGPRTLAWKAQLDVNNGSKFFVVD